MRLEETEQRREERRLGGSDLELFSPDSGQVEKALRPAIIAERCPERAKRQRNRIIVV